MAWHRITTAMLIIMAVLFITAMINGEYSHVNLFYRTTASGIPVVLVRKFPPGLLFLLHALPAERLRLDRPLLLSRVSASLR